MRTKSRSLCLSSESMTKGVRTQILSASGSSFTATFFAATPAGNNEGCLCLKCSSRGRTTSLPLPFDEAGLTEVALCEPLGETLLSATALLLLERLPPARSSAFRFVGEAGFDVVPALILLERRPAVSSLSFVFDKKASIGVVVVVVVDFDLTMASESTGSGGKRSGTWRELRVKLRARREQQHQHQHQQRQQPNFAAMTGTK